MKDAQPVVALAEGHDAPHRQPITRRGLLGSMSSLAAASLPLLGLGAESRADAGVNSSPGCREWTRPGAGDFAALLGRSEAELLDRALAVIEDEVVPKTLKGVRSGSKLFGAAVLSKDDLSTVLAATNTEAENPLLHGEITAINAFYAIPRAERPPVGDCIFLSTHEPCPLCIAGITWGGFDNFFYLFTYEDSRDDYGIPHDIVMLDEIFRCPEGSYNEQNRYWSSWGLRELVRSTAPEQQKALEARIAALERRYAEMSDIYQRAKQAGTGADVPLK